jgi:hypothetical protein
MRIMCGLVRKLVAIASLATLLALAAGASSVPPSATSRGSGAAERVLPWIEDDYSRALAQARTRKLPIFVESWAPW